jgi:hypothetical protein
MSKDYSIIIGVYAGINWLPQIINACNRQCISPEHITIWINRNTDMAINLDTLQQKHPDIRIVWNNRNLGVYSRFSAALLDNSSRYLILDDDTIPAPNWIGNCFDTLKVVGEDAILGYRGIRLKSNALYDVEAFEKGTTEITEVDLVGHAWFCTKKHILAMFEDLPVNHFNGEDTHLSAINQIKYGTKTYVPKQLVTDPNSWGSTKQHLGAQQGRLSTSLGPQEHFKQREEVNKHWLSRGWKPLYARTSANSLPQA